MEIMLNSFQRIIYVMWHILRRNRNFLGFAFAALIFSGVSFYTTYQGLLAYGYENTSFFISLALQSFMFFLAMTLSAKVIDEKLQQRHQGAQRRKSGFFRLHNWFALLAFCALSYLFHENLIGGFFLVMSAIITIAFAIALAYPRTRLVSFTYFFVMTISVIFSFDTIYSWTSPPEERFRDASIRARSDIGTVISDLEKKLAEKSEEKSESLFNGSDSSWSLYKKQLKSVSEQAEKEGPKLEASERRRINQMNEQRKDAENQVVGFTGSLSELRNMLTLAEREIEQLESTVNDLLLDTNKLSEELQVATFALKTREALIKRETDGENGGAAGCESFCEYYKTGNIDKIKTKDRYKNNQARYPEIDSLDVLVGNVSQKQSELGPKENVLKARQAELSEKKNLIASLPAQIKALENQLKDAQNTVNENTRVTPVVEASTPTEEVSAVSLNLAISDFESKPSLENFETLVSECNQISKFLVNLGVETDCSGEFSAETAGLFALEQKQLNFKQMCNATTLEAAVKGAGSSLPVSADAEAIGDGSPNISTTQGSSVIQGDSDNSRKGAFNRLIDFGRKCVVVAGTDIDSSAQNSKLDTLQLRIDPDSNNRLAQNYEELNDFNPQAWFSGILALAMDSLVLFASIYGAGRQLPPGLGYPKGFGPNGTGGGGRPQHDLTIDEEEAIRDVSLKVDCEPNENDPQHIYKVKMFIRVCDDHSLRCHLEKVVIVPDWVTDEDEMQIIREIIPKYRNDIRISANTEDDGFGNEIPVYEVDQGFYMELVRKISEYQQSVLTRQGLNPEFHPAGKKKSANNRSVFQSYSNMVDVTPGAGPIGQQPIRKRQITKSNPPVNGSGTSHSGGTIPSSPIPPTKSTQN